jgi:DNA polymerase-3 subunit delta'
MNREQQKLFLQYAMKVMRDCFLNTAAGVECRLGSGDEKFDSQFPKMITTNNIELIQSAFDDAIFAIERNAYAKIVMMELSFRISKALKKR